MTQPEKPETRQELVYRAEPVRPLYADAGNDVRLWGTGGLLVALGFFCWVMALPKPLDLDRRVVGPIFLAGLFFVAVGLAFLVAWAIRGRRRRR